MALVPRKNQPPPVLTDRWFSSGPQFRRWLDTFQKDHENALGQLGLAAVVATAKYSAVVTPDLSMGAVQRVTVTDGSAFTIGPVTKITQLVEWSLSVVNASGGAMGAVTFDASIHQSGFSAPANGKRTTAKFYVDGTTSYQIGSWSAAI